MRERINITQLRKQCFNAQQFPKEVLDFIERENLWNIWVPKQYGGLEMSLVEGLKTLRLLAEIDGSLGWTVTLCSGANFFIGNLPPKAANEIFGGQASQVCFGGSGGVYGTAEKQGDFYKISGNWHYATGAVYLTHFTLNAKIIEHGKELQNDDGSPMVRSFLLPRNKVKLIKNWNTMGLKASVTHSFEVKEVLVDQKYSFWYNQVQLDYPIFKIPFTAFADLTLLANYIGMAAHFLEEAKAIRPQKEWGALEEAIEQVDEKMFQSAQEITTAIVDQIICIDTSLQEIHTQAVESVQLITKAIFRTYPFLGIAASRESHPINQVFRDYFTATQHHIFTKDR